MLFKHAMTFTFRIAIQIDSKSNSCIEAPWIEADSFCVNFSWKSISPDCIYICISGKSLHFAILLEIIKESIKKTGKAVSLETNSEDTKYENTLTD